MALSCLAQQWANGYRLAMKFGWIKRFMPRSLFGRALLILVVPIIALQVVVAVVFVQRHFDGVSNQMASAVAHELAFAVDTVETAPDAATAQDRLTALAVPLGLSMYLRDGETITRIAPRRFFDVSGGAITDAFLERINRPISLDLGSEDKIVVLSVQTDKGVIDARIPRRRLVAANPRLLLFWMLSTSAVLTFVAVLFLRNQIRPIRQLAAAAEAFGKGRGLRFRPAGAEEVRRAGAAFLSMRARIERHVEQRTSMLSGVSHDLRTPLTRMKLSLAVSDPGPESDALHRDVEEMEKMVEGFLAFARGEGVEPSSETDPVALVEDIVVAERRSGAELTFASSVDTPEAPNVTMRPVAVRRAIQNLVNNALTHGSAAALSVRLRPKSLEFAVEDNGPGIPDDARPDALRPFVRLDPARNQDRGAGVGLGLAIAMDVARGHGGSLELLDGKILGGLRAVIRIPR